MIILASQTRYPNQKQITVVKTAIENGDFYLRIKKDALRRAAQRLDAGPFKLYIYLADNKDGYRLNLSQIALERDFGMKKNQFYKSIEKLIETGYLYQPDPSKNNWLFLENGSDPPDDQGSIFPKREDDSPFPKGEGIFPKEEDIFPKTDEVFPKSVEKDNKNIEDKENSFFDLRSAFEKYKATIS